MKEFTRKVVSAVAPVFGVILALSVLEAADVPFPPDLAWYAWPQWAVFTGVVYACTSLCMGIAERICAAPGVVRS
jgi:protein-S-isoprenylcysteine O-methyltransferase Ste14